MDAQAGKATQEQILQFMTTEHFTLQTAKSATVAEANGRATLFLSTVSSAVVALAFIGQVSGMGRAFFLFGLVLFPSLLFLGFVTFERAIQTAIENMIHSRGINRIRHYYLELAPEVRRYFIHSAHDDVPGALHNMGIVPSSSEWQHFVTNAGMIAVINSVLAGVFAGLLAGLASSWPIYVSGGLGIAAFALSVAAHRRYQLNKYKEFEPRLKILFPTAPDDGPQNPR
jgi:hypothetical protein